MSDANAAAGTSNGGVGSAAGNHDGTQARLDPAVTVLPYSERRGHFLNKDEVKRFLACDKDLERVVTQLMIAPDSTPGSSRDPLVLMGIDPASDEGGTHPTLLPFGRLVSFPQGLAGCSLCSGPGSFPRGRLHEGLCQGVREAPIVHIGCGDPRSPENPRRRCVSPCKC